MSPKSSKQFEQIRQEKKKLIMDTALELFAENGFHATSISQITKKAGISKGLIYNYFESKNEILQEITRSAFENIYSNFDLDKDGILTKEEFITFIRSSFRSTVENRQFWKLYYALVLQPSILDSYMHNYAKEGQRIMQMMRTFFESQGSTNPEGDLFSVSCLLKGTYLILVTAPEFFPFQEMEDKVIQDCFKLISKK